MTARLTAIQPHWAVEGGRISIHGSGFPVDRQRLPEVRIGDVPSRAVYASSTTISVLIPSGLDGGRTPVRVEDVPGETGLVEVGTVFASGLHQVDNPVYDREGNLYVTYSGTRGQEVPVSIFRVSPSGRREPFVSGIVNPTSMAFDSYGNLYVSSRFEGAVYRVRPDGNHETFASNLGVTCGLAFGRDDVLFVGDRSGTVFMIEPGGRARVLANLPSSVAAYHLAAGPDDAVYVTGPTLGPYDHVYRISTATNSTSGVERVYSGFGRPQGLAFDAQGSLYVVEALAGWSGLYRLRGAEKPELVVAGKALVGVAFNPLGGLAVASNDTVFRLGVGMRPL